MPGGAGVYNAARLVAHEVSLHRQSVASEVTVRAQRVISGKLQNSKQKRKLSLIHMHMDLAQHKRRGKQTLSEESDET